MKSLKKIAAVVATLALTVGMTANCFAASWQSYFGVNEAWFEGAEGKLSSQSATGWTADMKTIGWGGCWGAQVKQSVKVKKGEEYTIKYTLSSSKCDKWVFVKIADKKENFAYGKWVKIKKGKSVSVNETFKATADSDTLTFGIGGEFGDRKGIDKDATKRYSYASGGAASLNDGDPTYSTTVKCTGFSFEAKSAASTGTNSTDTNTNTNTNTNTTGSTGTTNNNTTSTTVATGDFSPKACGAAAILAGVALVVFARKREA